MTNGGVSNLTMCCSVCFRRTCTRHLHLRPSGARNFGRHRERGVAEGTQEFCCHREELAVAEGGGVMSDPGDMLSRVAERKSCHMGVHR